MAKRYALNTQGERGVVLLLALVALLLISAVGAAILFMTASESSLVGFQRRTTRTFQAALGAAEEARGRLRVSDPSFLGNWQTGQLDFPNPEVVGGVGQGVGANLQVLYIINPAPGEVVAPWLPANQYYDSWFATEFGINIELIPICPTPPIVAPGVPPPAPLTASCGWNVTSDMWVGGGPFAGLAPPMPYKWARITLLTESAANRDINGTGAPLDNNIPVFWNFSSNECYPSAAFCLYQAIPNSMNIMAAPAILDFDASGNVERDERIGRPVYRITALAALDQRAVGASPTATLRLVQYDVAAPKLQTDFPAAISLSGQGSSCGASVGVVEKPPLGTNNFGALDPPLYPDPMSGDNCALCDSGGLPPWTKKYARSGASSIDGNDEAGAALGGPAIGFTDPATGWDCFCEIRGSSVAMTVPDQCRYGGKAINAPAYQGGNTTAQYLCPAPPCIDDVSAALADLDERTELEALMDSIRDNADNVVMAGDVPPQTDGNPANNMVNNAQVPDWGTCDETVSPPLIDSRIIVLDGDATLGGAQSGCGILLVTGDLTTMGAWEWKGVVLVIGEGSFGVMGGGSGGVRGATFVSRLYCDEGSHGALVDPADTPMPGDADPSEPGDCPCIPGNPGCSATDPGILDPPAGASMRVSGGGSIGIKYNSFFINSASRNTRPLLLAYRELGQ